MKICEIHHCFRKKRAIWKVATRCVLEFRHYAVEGNGKAKKTKAGKIWIFRSDH